ncbi:hypothetical protein E2C01_082532 [Portunus trituberculatus]|uniref:Uncharacterized protein n=1 Tax=Portunus trituberculatus TaxID=210409 RepID=A0A5B7ISL5_PORTR|nr:hypothetical protein [Portunus trituberculatus]
MSQETTSRAAAAEEHTRGCCGCFGWFLRFFRRKKRGRRQKNKDPEPSLTALASNTGLLENEEENENGATVAAEDVKEARQAEVDDEEVAEEGKEPKVVKTWAEEVDEAEEKGLDLFAPISCLPHIATVHCDTEASPENEVTAATATYIEMSATQRRRARRKALAAARKASPENEAPAAAAADNSDSTQQPQAPEGTPLWPAPYVGAHGSDRCAFMPEALGAARTHCGTSATRRRRARRKALTAYSKSEARLAATTEESLVTDKGPVWPSPSVRVFGSDGRPLVITWEAAAYGAFHAQRETY